MDKSVGQSISENEAYVRGDTASKLRHTRRRRTSATVLSLNNVERLRLPAARPRPPMSTASVRASRRTDRQADYAPGTVTIYGSCWQAGGIVQIVLTEVPEQL
jgi:hypothetical protein